MKRLRFAVTAAALLAFPAITMTDASAATFVKTKSGSLVELTSKPITRTKINFASKKHRKVKLARSSKGKTVTARRKSRNAVPASGARGAVVATIKRMAPSYGVPTWFALRIAMIESSYNPRARGPAGEYGVYQLKCQTARGIGFRGNCGALLNTHTNVHYGLKHLSQAIRLSRGNLRLAASKHNGGLGRRSLVPKYVARVF